MKLQIEKAIYGGASVAHGADGESVSVPFVLPGELVEVQIQRHKKNSEEASLLQVLKESVDRVQPPCPHFGECGGCHYQHAQYSMQVKMKASILQETLERAGLNALPEIQSHSAAPWAYRNRMRLRLEAVGPMLRAGYNRRGTNEFLAIQECHITAPLLWRAAQGLLQVATENTAVSRWLGDAVEAEFFTTADEKKLQMTVFVRKDQPGLAPLCDRIKQLVPELAGAGTSLLKPTRTTATNTEAAALGELGSTRLELSSRNRRLLGEPRRLFPGQSLSHRGTRSDRRNKSSGTTGMGSICRRGIIFSSAGEKRFSRS